MLNILFIIITINTSWFWLFICLLNSMSSLFKKQKIIYLLYCNVICFVFAESRVNWAGRQTN